MLILFFIEMRLLISLIVACVFWSAGEASVLSRPLQREWKAWKNLHSKQYLDHSQELTRQAVWLANREYINRHNSQADEHGYTLKMNHLGDLVMHDNIRQRIKKIKIPVVLIIVYTYPCQ